MERKRLYGGPRGENDEDIFGGKGKKKLLGVRRKLISRKNITVTESQTEKNIKILKCNKKLFFAIYGFPSVKKFLT